MTRSLTGDTVSTPLTLVRGLPGSGKTTFAGPEATEADQYFIDDDGVYQFDPSQLAEAHAWCQEQTRQKLADGQDVTVANTFTQRWELEPYLQMAKEFGVEVVVKDIFDGGQDNDTLTERNVHSVPYDAICDMRERYEHDWKSGNPTPPWER